MSTYLVAFSVSQFKYKTKDNSKIFVYTYEDKLDQVEYIEDKAIKLLDLMEIYTSIPYPYSKVDLLALPDLSFGAMENWGLNTYRYTNKLYKRNLTILYNYKSYLHIITTNYLHSGGFDQTSRGDFKYQWLKA